MPASPLDWVMKYARITLVQLKVDRGDIGEIQGKYMGDIGEI